MRRIKRLENIIRTARAAKGPRLSLYLPTHRVSPDNAQDAILFKNLLQQAEKILADNYPRREWEELMNKLRDLQNDSMFWRYTLDGLCILGAGNELAIFRLSQPVAKAVAVEQHFHILPLLAALKTEETAYLADIGRDRLTLYQVAGSQIVPIEDDNIKMHFSELFDDFDPNGDLNVGVYGGLQGSYHGHRARPEEIEKDREKYFRYLDNAFAELYKEDGHPFILSGTSENVNEFQSFAKGNFYLENVIDKPLASLPEGAVDAELERIMKPLHEAYIVGALTRLAQAKQTGACEMSLEEIRKAAEENRIKELLVHTEALFAAEKLDSVLEAIIDGGGKVTTVDVALEEDSHIAAILRYAN